jgi:hypothetical protein
VDPVDDTERRAKKADDQQHRAILAYRPRPTPTG